MCPHAAASCCSNFTAGDFEGDTPEDDFAENNHVFMGFVGIQDPVRPEVPEALRKCRRAQISVMMVTGDHLDTAVAIAKQCSILDDDGRFDAMEGAAFREAVLNSDGSLNQAKFDAIWPTLRVLARSSPEDKLTLVTGLQNSGLYRVYRDNPVAWGDRVSFFCVACASRVWRLLTPCCYCLCGSCCPAADLQGSPGDRRDWRWYQRRPCPLQVRCRLLHEGVHGNLQGRLRYCAADVRLREHCVCTWDRPPPAAAELPRRSHRLVLARL